MPVRIDHPSVWLLSIGLFAGCGSVADPEADRRSIERFVADPGKADPHSAKEAAERLVRSNEIASTPRDDLILAAYYDAVGDAASALDRLSRIPDDLEDPKTAAAARLSEGRIAFFRTRQARRAETALLAATRLDPDANIAWLPLADLYDVQNRRSQRDACYAKLDAASALDRNRLLNWTCDRKLDAETEEQAQVLTALVAADPADVDSAIALAEDRIRRGDFEGAQSVLDRIDASDDPAANQAIMLQRARIEADQGDTDKAAELLGKLDADALVPRHASLYHRIQGRIAIQARSYAEAETFLRNALAAERNDREAHQLLVQTLRLADRANEAEEVSTRLAAIDRLEDLGQKVRASLRRDDPNTLREIADTAIGIGRLDLAKAWLRQLLTKDPLSAGIQQEIYRLDQRSKAAK